MIIKKYKARSLVLGILLSLGFLYIASFVPSPPTEYSVVAIVIIFMIFFWMYASMAFFTYMRLVVDGNEKYLMSVSKWFVRLKIPVESMEKVKTATTLAPKIYIYYRDSEGRSRLVDVDLIVWGRKQAGNLLMDLKKIVTAQPIPIATSD